MQLSVGVEMDAYGDITEATSQDTCDDQHLSASIGKVRQQSLDF